MQAEERNTGAISWSVYKQYSKLAEGGSCYPYYFRSCLCPGCDGDGVVLAGVLAGRVGFVLSSGSSRYADFFQSDSKWDRPQGFYVSFISTYEVKDG